MLGQRTSPFLQEKLAELGSDEVFGVVPDRISSLLGIDVNHNQVYRVCQNVAAALDEQEIAEPSEEMGKIQENKKEEVYGMVDGSMLFTDEGWQETKVGRVFNAELIDKEQHKWKIKHSQYVARRGHYGNFTANFERLLPPASKCKKIFITDGAQWIIQWLSERYPKSVFILDFFHVCEKLGSIAPADKTNWLDEQKDRLLAGEFSQVIKTVQELPNAASPQVGAVLGYLKNNRERMDYQHYREKGWMIGSGPIESAHRTLLQIRMKRSGQRWADDGCDNMIKLRVAYKNNRRDLIQKALGKAA